MSAARSEPQVAQEMHDSESAIKRNPHGDFNQIQAARPDWDASRSFHFTKTLNPEWNYGSGSNSPSNIPHVGIDPYEEGRAPAANYKLLISGIIPRPVGFLSTVSADGSSSNLAPFSYTQVINHDPPIFTIGFSGGLDKAKDTLRNLIDTKECVINIISEPFIEAANACAIDLPYGQSEWSVTGLTPAETTHVKSKRVKESVFAIEGRLQSTQEFESRATPGKKTGVLAIVEGVKFWVREDAINDEKNLIDPEVLRPIARLGGITYARVADGFEIPRPVMRNEVKQGKLDTDLMKPKVDGQ